MRSPLAAVRNSQTLYRRMLEFFLRPGKRTDWLCKKIVPSEGKLIEIPIYLVSERRNNGSTKRGWRDFEFCWKPFSRLTSVCQACWINSVRWQQGVWEALYDNTVIRKFKLQILSLVFGLRRKLYKRSVRNSNVSRSITKCFRK